MPFHVHHTSGKAGAGPGFALLSWRESGESDVEIFSACEKEEGKAVRHREGCR